MTKDSGIRPVVLIVMDGYGCSDLDLGNAVTRGQTPNLDGYVRSNPHGLIEASGLFVGLPAGQMGNSEVGHLNLGAGKVVYQDFTRVSRSIEDGSFFTNPALTAACDHVLARKSTLHVMGLIGVGGVHAHQKHLYAVLDLALPQGVSKCCHSRLHRWPRYAAARCPRSSVGVWKRSLAELDISAPSPRYRVAITPWTEIKGGIERKRRTAPSRCCGAGCQCRRQRLEQLLRRGYHRRVRPCRP